jgi:6-pyruvoyltetrahydropterin/6-carboxytetrahydropterin synthase
VILSTRRYRFAAAHVLANPALPDDENRRIYGKCANPNGHGHDYGLEVTVTGTVDPVTGSIVPQELLDSIVRERVLDRLSHRMLNADPLFADRVPTAENIALAVRESLEKPLEDAAGVRLVNVRVVETPRNFFDHGEAP